MKRINDNRCLLLFALLLAHVESALAWQNVLQDPGFERYHFDNEKGYYVPDPGAAWREYGFGAASVRFDASSWTAPPEMQAERALNFTPGAAGFEGYGATQNKGQLCLEQDFVNSSVLHSATYYEAWVWLGGAGQDITTGEERAEEIGGWQIFFYDNGDTSTWTESNAIEYHHSSLDYPGSPNSFVRISGYGKPPGNAVGFRFRAWANTWHAPAGGGNYGTRVALDNAHFAMINGNNLLANGNFEQDVNVADFTGWQRPAVYPFPKNGIPPLHIASMRSETFGQGGYRPFVGGNRTYGYSTYLNGWLDDAFTFSQTANYTAPTGTPVVLMCYWLQDTKGPAWRWQLRHNTSQLQFVVQYLNSSAAVIGTENILANWPIASNPANESTGDQNADNAYNPRFQLVPPAGTTQIRLNVNFMVHLPWQSGWELMAIVADDFWLGLVDQPVTILSPKLDQVTCTSARVRWTTDVYAGSIVDYGTTTSYGGVASDPNAVQFHAVTINGLMPGRKYYVRRKSGLAVYPTPDNAGTVFFTTLPFGDFDQDSDVDQADFGHLQACLTGADVAQTDPACANTRMDADSDVDEVELTGFLSCATAANVPLGTECH